MMMVYGCLKMINKDTKCLILYPAWILIVFHLDKMVFVLHNNYLLVSTAIMYLNLISSPTITLLCPLQTITFPKSSLNNKLWYPLPNTCMYPFVSANDNYLDILSKQLPVSILPTFNIYILSKIHVVQFSITITLWYLLSTIILLYPLPIRTIWYLLQKSSVRSFLQIITL